MGKVIVIEHLTLDGGMQSPGSADEDRRDGFRHGGWSSSGQDPAMQQVMGARMSSAWSLLAGRATYEQFADHWPRQESNPFTEALNRVQKYVASTTLHEPLAWQNSTLLQGDAADAVARLKEELDENLIVFGSGVLVPVAAAARPHRRVRASDPSTGPRFGTPPLSRARLGTVRVPVGGVHGHRHRRDRRRVPAR